MKNILLLLFLLMPLAAHANDGNNIIFCFNSGNLGLGFNFPSGIISTTEESISILNFGMEHTQSGIGFDISPYNSYYWTESGKSARTVNDTVHSLLNLTLYWNVLPGLDKRFYFGPYSSVNLLIQDVTIANPLLLTAGMRFGARFSPGRFTYNVISGEIGYRNIYGSSKFYTGIKIDALVLISAILYYKAKSKLAEND